MLNVREATRDDVEYLSVFMRKADKDEFKAASGMTVYKALEYCYLSGWISLCAENDEGYPVCMFGCRQTAPGEILCWMCGTDEMQDFRIRRIFWSKCKDIYEELGSRFKRLYCYVDARHEASCRWLKKLGLNFSEPFRYGVNGEFFYLAEKKTRGGKYMGMTLIATALTAATSIYAGISSYQASQQQAAIAEAQADSSAKQYENNAALAKAEADATSLQGFKEEQQLRDKARRVAAAQRAAYGASGVAMDSGSAFDVGLDTAVQAEQDANTLRKGYQRKKFALENEASNYLWNAKETKKLGAFQASSYRNAGRNALIGGFLGAASSVAGKWGGLKSGSGAKAQHDYGK